MLEVLVLEIKYPLNQGRSKVGGYHRDGSPVGVLNDGILVMTLSSQGEQGGTGNYQFDLVFRELEGKGLGTLKGLKVFSSFFPMLKWRRFMLIQF